MARAETGRALRTAGIVALVIAAALGYSRLAERKGYPLQIGSAAPTFDLPRLEGGRGGLAEARGRIVVVNFWATWCPPCVVEMPSLERLHRNLGPEGLTVFAVAADEDAAALRRFVAEHRLTLPILQDPGGRIAAAAYRTTGFPETFVIDRSGVLIQRVVGEAEWDSPEALAYFRGLLAGKEPARP